MTRPEEEDSRDKCDGKDVDDALDRKGGDPSAAANGCLKHAKISRNSRDTCSMVPIGEVVHGLGSVSGLPMEMGVSGRCCSNWESQSTR